MGEKTIKSELPEIISDKKYHFLKGFVQLTKEEKDQINQYERHYIDDLKLMAEKNKQYAEKVFAEKKIPKLDSKKLAKMFFIKYKELYGNFEPTKSATDNLQILVWYYCKDDRFFSSPNLSKLSQPSFDKGNLIIGGFGNGKSSFVKTFRSLFSGTPFMFGYFDANSVIEMYEECISPYDKKCFWDKMLKGEKYFDDVKTERLANNYGKANIFKDIIEKRYNVDFRTHITCNYKDGFEGDLKMGLKEFGELYGGRAYDRIFEMFNIIEFKGQSFRK